jgi:capsule polysaccharide export protein KpsE/RkpR
LRREIAGLEQELAVAREEAALAKRASADAVRAISALRSQLEPLHKALKMIFGEISRVDAQEAGASVWREAASPGLNPKWIMLKEKLGGRQAEFIDLLQHGEMTTAQLAAAAHCHRDAVAQVILKLNRAGVINKTGRGTFSLREL